MSDFDDAIGDMTSDLLTEAGTSCVYLRGTTSTTITLRKSTGQPYPVDAGNGMILEVRPVDFIALTTALPYAIPKQGDRILCGNVAHEVHPPTGDKVFRQISPQMTRIHTKQVK